MGLKSQEFFASGTFNVPNNISAVWLTLIGGGGGSGGGGGDPNPNNCGGGGGSSEMAQRIMHIVNPGGTLAITVGLGGVGNAAAQGGATDGGFTIVGMLRVNGGGGGGNSNGGAAGPGGGYGNGLISGLPPRLANGGSGGWGGLGFPRSNAEYTGPQGMDGRVSVKSSSCYQGGQCAGCGSGKPVLGLTAGMGAACGGQAGGQGGGTTNSGGGGGSNYYGVGATGQTVVGPPVNATVPGTGAGGSVGTPGGAFGGNGAPGYVLVTWCEP